MNYGFLNLDFNFIRLNSQSQAPVHLRVGVLRFFVVGEPEHSAGCVEADEHL